MTKIVFLQYYLLIIIYLCSMSSALAEDVFFTNSQDIALDTHEKILSCLQLNGSMRTDYFSSNKLLDDRDNFIGMTAQLKAEPVLNKIIDGKVEARFSTPDIIDHERTDNAGTLLEGYINIHALKTDFRIGKQNVTWGRADFINPTDNLTPRNFMTLLPFEEDQRFGTVALKLDRHFSSEYTLSFFTTPFFEPSKIPLLLPPGAVTYPKKPAHTLSNIETGIRLNKISGEIDWSVSYYHGFSLIPEIRFKGVQAQSSFLLALSYPEINVFGADFACNFGQYGFRAEAAFISSEDYSNQEYTQISPYLYYVLGIDRTFGEDVNINLQAIGRWIDNFQDPSSVPNPIFRLIARNNAILFGQHHLQSYGASSRISKRWLNETFETELLTVIYFDPINAYIRPLTSYAITDKIKGSIGAELYDGDDGTFFGSRKRNKCLFSELRYLF